MELRHLRYLIAVAEAGSFRVAAERIRVTQPAVTRQIRDLELELDVTLFRRSSLGVELTSAGVLFVKEARAVLNSLKIAAHRAKRVAAGIEGALSIGFVENASWDGIVPVALSLVRQQAPDVTLELLPNNVTLEQIKWLQSGRTDGAFIYSFEEFPSGIKTIDLLQKQAVLAVPKAWGWVEQSPVSIKSLGGRPLIAFPRHIYPASYDYLLKNIKEAGASFDVTQEVSTEAAILLSVSVGMGAAIVNSNNRAHSFPLVTFLDLVDIQIMSPLKFAYLRDHVNPALSHLIDALSLLLLEK